MTSTIPLCLDRTILWQEFDEKYSFDDHCMFRCFFSEMYIVIGNQTAGFVERDI